MFAFVLLKEVGLRLRRFVKDESDIARLGGDEFVVLFHESAQGPRLFARVRELLGALAQPFAIDDVTVSCTASAGIAVYPMDNASPDTLLRHADQAMYQAKQAGRGNLHLFDALQDQQVQTTHTRMARIGEALQSEEFRLHYQPKVYLRSGDIIGFEALLRWQHPEDGLVGPQAFLPLIEETDLIVDIGEWVISPTGGLSQFPYVYDRMDPVEVTLLDASSWDEQTMTIDGDTYLVYTHQTELAEIYIQNATLIV